MTMDSRLKMSAQGFIFSNSLPTCGKFWRPLMTFANSLDPDNAPQNVGPYLRSKLFDVEKEKVNFANFWRRKNLVCKELL